MTFNITDARDPSLSCAAAKVMVLDAADELTLLRELVKEMREAMGRGLDDFQVLTSVAWDRKSRSIIAKADAILKESGEPVKYGCHYTDGVVSHDCATSCSERRKVYGASDCDHWKPIK